MRKVEPDLPTEDARRPGAGAVVLVDAVAKHFAQEVFVGGRDGCRAHPARLPAGKDIGSCDAE